MASARMALAMFFDEEDIDVKWKVMPEAKLQNNEFYQSYLNKVPLCGQTTE
jgi:hypothetical protein